MITIYSGDFVSRWDDSRWLVEILEERETAPSAVGELEFAAENPLQIEWPETSKEEVICGSTATLKLLSPGDRTYAGLYTIEAGRIGLQVKRNGTLYWAGTLDPEFYEEPYSCLEDYEVELTFSDFGILERLKYGLEGLQTLEAIMADALGRSRLLDLLGPMQTVVDQSLISSEIPTYGGNWSVLQLAYLSVRSDNFTDEDGETSNLRDVVEGVLQPLGLRMVQRGGRIWVYDLNGLYGADLTIPALRWHSDDQVLGVDKVANSVKVTFSPYGGSEVTDQEVSYLGDIDKEAHILGDNTAIASTHAFTYYSGIGVAEGHEDEYSFTIFESGSTDDGVGASLGEHARYFHIEPIYGAEKCDGVVWGFLAREETEVMIIGFNHISLPENQAVNALQPGDGRYRPWEPVLTTYRVWLPKTDAATAARLLLRLRLELMADVRHNPFEESGDNNNKLAFEWASGHACMVRVPVGIRMRIQDTDDGAVTYHWENPNDAILFGDMLQGSLGVWVYGDYTSLGNEDTVAWPAWLEWYDPESSGDTVACAGWSKNRQALSNKGLDLSSAETDVVGIDYRQLPAKVRKLSDGQLLPYPTSGGWLEVTVYSTVEAFGYSGDRIKENESAGFRERLRWQLYKAPTVELVWADTREAVEQDDVEYKGVINPQARDEISLETTCGTAEDSLPTAKGLYYRSSQQTPLTVMRRNGREDCPEHLLIGTLHSQFASRHVKLSGTADLLTGGLKLYSEYNQEGRVFLVTSDVQDVDAGTSEAVFIELSGDEYEQGH